MDKNIDRECVCERERERERKKENEPGEESFPAGQVVS